MCSLVGLHGTAHKLHTREHINATWDEHPGVVQVHVILEAALGSTLFPVFLRVTLGVDVEMLEVAFRWHQQGISFVVSNYMTRNRPKSAHKHMQ